MINAFMLYVQYNKVTVNKTTADYIAQLNVATMLIV